MLSVFRRKYKSSDLPTLPTSAPLDGPNLFIGAETSHRDRTPIEVEAPIQAPEAVAHRHATTGLELGYPQFSDEPFRALRISPLSDRVGHCIMTTLQISMITLRNNQVRTREENTCCTAII